VDDKKLENDQADPRFKMTPDELKAKGIKDFQLWYALETLRAHGGGLPPSLREPSEMSLKRAHAIALLVPAALLGGAYASQYLGAGALRDVLVAALCPFCRAGAGGGGWCPLRRLAVMLAGLALATAALIGGYHAGVEYGWWKGITECTSAVSFAGGGDPLAAIMARRHPLRCGAVEAVWHFDGGLDFLISGAAALAVLRCCGASGHERQGGTDVARRSGGRIWRGAHLCRATGGDGRSRAAPRISARWRRRRRITAPVSTSW
jgi:hypothetical protein